MFNIFTEKSTKEFVKQGIDRMYLPWNYKQAAKFLVDGCGNMEELAGVVMTVWFGLPLW